ncbi:hypothetical protein BH24ACT26_BH24ACT26_20260 [soil metagenome]
MSIERARSCGLYLPGHDVHWIQARLSVEEELQRPSTPGLLLGVQPDGLVVVEVNGVVRRLWNHDTDRLEQLVARNRGEVSHQPGFGLLKTPSEKSSYLFCVADADSPDLRPCLAHPPPAAPWSYFERPAGSRSPDRKPSIGANLREKNEATASGPGYERYVVLCPALSSLIVNDTIAAVVGAAASDPSRIAPPHWRDRNVRRRGSVRGSRKPAANPPGEDRSLHCAPEGLAGSRSPRRTVSCALREGDLRSSRREHCRSRVREASPRRDRSRPFP